MKKILTIGLFLGLLTAAATTVYCSLQAEQALRAGLDQLNRMSAGLLRGHLETYQPGLFSSRALTKLQFGDVGALTLRHRLRHLPWGLEILSQVQNDSLAELKISQQQPLERIQLRTWIVPWGGSRTSFVLPKRLLVNDAGETQLTGLSFSATLARDLVSGEMNITLMALDLLRAGLPQLAMQGIAVRGEIAGQQRQSSGSGVAHIDHLAVGNDKQPLLEVGGFRCGSSWQRDGASLGVAGDMRLAQIAALSERFSEAHLNFVLQGLRADEEQPLAERLWQLLTDLFSPKVDPLFVQLQILDLFRQLLEHGFVLQLEQLELHSDEGELRGDGSLQLPEWTYTDEGQVDLQRWSGDFQLELDLGILASCFRLADKLLHQGRPSANRGVLNEQAEQLAGALVQKGLLTGSPREGYRVSMSLMGGQVQLNGQPVALQF